MPDQNRKMYKAVCAECGKECEVPFEPTSDKPVYCQACFAKRRGGLQQKRGFTAVCAKCGKQFNLNFQPTPGKQVYCNQCFGRGGAQARPSSVDQLQILNSKLDKIINALIDAKIIKVKAKAESVKVKAEKPAKKKVAAKKPAKKTAKKKK